MDWGSAVGILFTNHCLAAISTQWQYSSALLAAENNSESASKGLPFNWAEHLPKRFSSWWTSPPWMRSIQALPSQSCSLQRATHCRTWLIVPVLSCDLYFHNGLSSHVGYISTSLHKLADIQHAGACDTTPFCSPPCYMAAPCCRVGTWKCRHTWPGTSGDKSPCSFQSNLLSHQGAQHWEGEVKPPLCFLLCHWFNCWRQLLNTFTQC